jgi:hypothetical protein
VRFFLVAWLLAQLLPVSARFTPPASKVPVLPSHSKRSTLRCGNKVKWVSGTLRTTFFLKVGFAVPPNYAFKPTAGEVFRINQSLPAGGGLTRR